MRKTNENQKILNQNAVLVDDQGEEKIAIGKGVGFNKQRNDLLFSRDIERLFVMEPEGQQKLQTLLNQINESYFLLLKQSLIMLKRFLWRN